MIGSDLVVQFDLTRSGYSLMRDCSDYFPLGLYQMVMGTVIAKCVVLLLGIDG